MRAPIILPPLRSVLWLATAVLATGAAGAPPEHFSANLRWRVEHAAQTQLRAATAMTVRLRLGYTTTVWRDWSAQVEAEHIAAADPAAYNQAGLNPAGADRVLVADPTGTELNQAWLRYQTPSLLVKLGRQALVLDSARFVGDVGWRQNAQTFDAFLLRRRAPAQPTLSYAYLSRIHRVLGRRHPQGVWRSDSHVLQAHYVVRPDAVTVTGYTYLLSFKNAAAQSCATYGLSAAGAGPRADGSRFTYRVEVATQTDYGVSRLNYSTHYTAIELGWAARAAGLAVGHEMLGTDHGVGFKTPLATLHAFNGWADVFAVTPATGLRDLYVKGTAALPAGVALTAVYHRFTAQQGGAGLGEELDVQLVRKFRPSVTGLIKYAAFRPQTPAWPEVDKLWVQVEYTY